MNPLIQAIKNNIINQLKLLIELGYNVKETLEYGRPILHFAIRSQADMPIIRVLVDQGADVNVKDDFGESPLLLATRVKSADIIEFLTENHAELNSRDMFCETPLISAAKQELKEIIEILIRKGADIHVEDANEHSLLEDAVIFRRNKDIVNLFIKIGVDENITEKWQVSPLYLAALDNYKELAELAISKGADVNTMTNNGETPLFEAVKNNFTELAELLIKNGADINAKNEAGQTPLALVDKNNQPQMYKLLISHGAKPPYPHTT